MDILQVADGLFISCTQGNILSSPSGVPLIADFGISRLPSATMTCTTNVKGTMRWMAVELIFSPRLDPSDLHSPPSSHTKSTDVWAFGMTVLVRLVMMISSIGRLLTSAACRSYGRKNRRMEIFTQTGSSSSRLHRGLCRRRLPMLPLRSHISHFGTCAGSAGARLLVTVRLCKRI